MAGRKALLLWGLLALTALVAYGCVSSGPKMPFESARDMQEDGAYADAIVAYQQYISEHPEGKAAPFAQYEIAKCQEASGMAGEAKIAFDKVVSDYPDSAPAGWVKEDRDFYAKHPELAPGAAMSSETK